MHVTVTWPQQEDGSAAMLAEMAVSCNTASLGTDGGACPPADDSTEVALLQMAASHAADVSLGRPAAAVLGWPG